MPARPDASAAGTSSEPPLEPQQPVTASATSQQEQGSQSDATAAGSEIPDNPEGKAKLYPKETTVASWGAKYPWFQLKG